MLISTRVAGGIAPLPLHVTWPELHSAVAQENFPSAAVVQPVRAQKRPFHGTGVMTWLLAPCASSKPVVGSWGCWSEVRVPGHTV